MSRKMGIGRCQSSGLCMSSLICGAGLVLNDQWGEAGS